jgi:hypothetical protein
MAGQRRTPPHSRAKCGLVASLHSCEVAGFAREAVSATHFRTPHVLGELAFPDTYPCVPTTRNKKREPDSPGWPSPGSMYPKVLLNRVRCRTLDAPHAGIASSPWLRAHRGSLILPGRCWPLAEAVSHGQLRRRTPHTSREHASWWGFGVMLPPNAILTVFAQAEAASPKMAPQGLSRDRNPSRVGVQSCPISEVDWTAVLARKTARRGESDEGWAIVA